MILRLGGVLMLFLFAPVPAEEAIRYVACGDSYTYGQDVETAESWPVLLTDLLKEEGIKIELVENIAVSGSTTKDVINNQLPKLERLNPDFITLLIGTNDRVQRVSDLVYRQNIREILSGLKKDFPAAKLLLVTVPDFSQLPAAGLFGGSKYIEKGLSTFNQILKEEASNFKIKVADIFSLSKKLSSDRKMFSRDHLHPSGKQYAEWAKVILPVASSVLSE